MATTLEPQTTQQPVLPGPDQRPLADVVIYDGHCRICTAQIRFIERWFAARRLAYLSLHDSRVAVRYPDLSYDELMREMWIVDRAGHRHGGGEGDSLSIATAATIVVAGATVAPAGQHAAVELAISAGSKPALSIRADGKLRRWQLPTASVAPAARSFPFKRRAGRRRIAYYAEGPSRS